MSSTKVEAPQPSAEERELQTIQLNQIREQEAEQAQLRPFQLESLGLIEETDEAGATSLRKLTEDERRATLSPSQQRQEDIRTARSAHIYDVLLDRREHLFPKINPSLTIHSLYELRQLLDIKIDF